MIPAGAGATKYKTCHMRLMKDCGNADAGAIVPDRSLIKNREMIDGIKRSAEINMACLTPSPRDWRGYADRRH